MNPVRNSISVEHSTEREISNGMNRRDFLKGVGLGATAMVMPGDQIDHDEGQPQSGLWFGNIDDLWGMGKPSGWGGPWGPR